MLILTRRIQEDVIIDDGKITVKVIGVKGNQVRLGIDAPKNISVHRSEIFDRIKKEKEDLLNNKEKDENGNI